MLPAEPSSVPTARRLVRTWMIARGLGELVDNAELAVSEVVTNALVHAGTEVQLVLSGAGDAVRVEVHDGSTHLPRLRRVDTAAGTGRGLGMLEWVVDRWGAEVHGDSKMVWFELGVAVPSETAPAA